MDRRSFLSAAALLPLASLPVVAQQSGAATETIPVKAGENMNAVIAAAPPGATIVLGDGLHRAINIRGLAKAVPVIVRSQNARNARVPWMKIKARCTNITFKDLSVWSDTPSGETVLCKVEPSCANIHFDGLDLRGAPDAANYMAWSRAQWVANRIGGIQNRAHGGNISNCVATATSFAFAVENGRLEGCFVRGFSGDAYRGVQSAQIIGNYCRDSFKIDKNHDDMFQSFNLTGTPFDGMNIENNVFVSWTGSLQHPLQGSRTQGVGMFDGFFDNLVIRNNVVVTDHFHGLTVAGCTNALFEGNIALNVLGAAMVHRTHPWLKVAPHKNGQPSRNIIVRNNITVALALHPRNINATYQNNLTVTDPAAVQSILDTLELER